MGDFKYFLPLSGPTPEYVRRRHRHEHSLSYFYKYSWVTFMRVREFVRCFLSISESIFNDFLVELGISTKMSYSTYQIFEKTRTHLPDP